MQLIHKKLLTVAAGLLMILAQAAQAQPPERFLTLTPQEGLPIIPVMEGWTANEDGSRTISFGYINRNEEAVDIPVGENNRIEPAEFSGMQPSHFPSGRGTGVFTVHVPADRVNEDVWWYVKSGNGSELKVPGRSNASAYELDFIRPRPQGSLQPHIGVGEDGQMDVGLDGDVFDHSGTVKAGEPVILTANVMDPSERDPSDPRFAEPLDVGVQWNLHQGPAAVTFERHESTVVPEPPTDERRLRFYREQATNEVDVKGGKGLAKVIATFPEPGEYLLRLTAENFSAPDSSDADQCCWTNIFERITVTE